MKIPATKKKKRAKEKKRNYKVDEIGKESLREKITTRCREREEGGTRESRSGKRGEKEKRVRETGKKNPLTLIHLQAKTLIIIFSSLLNAYLFMRTRLDVTLI